MSRTHDRAKYICILSYSYYIQRPESIPRAITINMTSPSFDWAAALWLVFVLASSVVLVAGVCSRLLSLSIPLSLFIWFSPLLEWYCWFGVGCGCFWGVYWSRVCVRLVVYRTLCCSSSNNTQAHQAMCSTMHGMDAHRKWRENTVISYMQFRYEDNVNGLKANNKSNL